MIKTSSSNTVRATSLVSRVLNREADTAVKTGPTGAKEVRKDGRPINLFRYDYEDLNEPMMLDIDLSATLSTELFETAGKDTVEDLVDETAETIVRRLKRDRLVGG